MRTSRVPRWAFAALIAFALAAPAFATVDKSGPTRPMTLLSQIEVPDKGLGSAPSGGVSDCCFSNGTPGCDDPTCEALICGLDPFCCDTTWDSVCAGEALDLCAVCQGAAPANDDCDAAAPVAVPSTTSDSTVFAGVEAAFPLCGDNFGANPTAPGVWYEVTGTGNVLEASTCNQATYDTQLTVYCQDCATPTCIEGNDDGVGCAGFSSLLQWESEVGATYRILVHGFGSAIGNFDLSVTDTGVPSTNPAPCFGPVGACCDPSTAGCTQSDEYLCTLAGGNFAAGLPCAVPTGNVFSYARSPGVPIPDNNTTGVADTVNVPDGFLVASASVDVDISHTWIGDLRIRLENVATGQIINMWDRRCGNIDNMDITYIDGGLTTLCTDVPLGTGQADPTVSGLGPPFATLNGTAAMGDWRLIVDDNAMFDTGTLNSWTLNLQEGNAVCYAYPPVQEIPTMDRRGLAALALLLAGAAAFLIWRRRG